MAQKGIQVTDQQESLQSRLPIVVALMAVVAFYLVVSLITLQYQPDTVVTYYNRLASYNYNQNRRVLASRGMIYDRDGHPLASNTVEYEIGISPSLVSSARDTATKLGTRHPELLAQHPQQGHLGLHIDLMVATIDIQRQHERTSQGS